MCGIEYILSKTTNNHVLRNGFEEGRPSPHQMLHPISRGCCSVQLFLLRGLPATAQRNNNITFKLKTYRDGKPIKSHSNSLINEVVETVHEAFPAKGDSKWCYKNRTISNIHHHMNETTLLIISNCPSNPPPNSHNFDTPVGILHSFRFPLHPTRSLAHRLMPGKEALHLEKTTFWLRLAQVKESSRFPKNLLYWRCTGSSLTGNRTQGHPV